MSKRLSRRLTRHRWAASVAAAALTLGGGLVALAPTAGAGTVTPVMRCTTPVGAPEGQQQFEVTLDPTHGDGATSMHVVAGGSPATSPIPIPLATIKSVYTFAMSGGTTGDLSAAPPSFETPIEVNTPIVPPPFTVPTTIVGAAAGSTVDLTLKSIVVQTIVGGNLLATATCVPISGNGVVASYTVEQGSQAPTLTATPSTVDSNSRVTLSGAHWPAGPVGLTMCFPEFGGFCDNGYSTIAASDVKVVDGVLSGWVHVAGAVPSTAALLKVTSGSVALEAPLTVVSVPVGGRGLVLSPNTGPVGTQVTVTGTAFSPNAQITVQPQDEPGAPTEDAVTTTADANGSFTATFTVTAAATAAVAAYEFGNPAIGMRTPYTVGEGPARLTQSVSGQIKPGGLTMSQAGGRIDFGSATIDGKPLRLNAALNRVTVVDARGTDLGWSLTGTMSELTAENGTDKLPAGSVAWTPACVAADGAPGTVTPGTPGPLGATQAQLCTQTPVEGRATGGSVSADAALTLTTPAFVRPGTYSGALTLSLS
ncbi:WxL domain-containing protein (plasmid) [Embleya sp. NBC_00888]|uniref:hypothetical protein n=1 Tax=Embleya sp. NBC_00888 TaxID=2975960 RepID=UPI002F907BDF|nr:WxL domain-containing protein [Embleya sp. NBC_00888]